MEPRCEFTGNPCGTDTWAKDGMGNFIVCPCASCQKWYAGDDAWWDSFEKTYFRRKMFEQLESIEGKLDQLLKQREEERVKEMEKKARKEAKKQQKAW